MISLRMGISYTLIVCGLVCALPIVHTYVITVRRHDHNNQLQKQAFITTLSSNNNIRLYNSVGRDNVEDPISSQTKPFDYINDNDNDIDNERVEAFLDDARSDMEDQIQVVDDDDHHYHDDMELIIDEIREDNSDLDYDTDVVGSTTSAYGTTNSKHGDDSIKMGMMGSFNKAVMEPSKLRQHEEENCEHVYRDFATGDELCWADDDGDSEFVSSTTRKEATMKETKNKVTANKRLHPNPKDDHIKMGMMGSHNKAVMTPTRLKSGIDVVSGEEVVDCEEPYIDFATGDELCWGEM